MTLKSPNKEVKNLDSLQKLKLIHKREKFLYEIV